MSRLAKKALQIPDGVKFNYDQGLVSVEGKLGKLEQTIMQNFIDLKIEDKKVLVNRKGDSKPFKAYQGLYWSLIRNFINGVTLGFTKTLVIQGLGFKWEMKGKQLVIICGYSNPVHFDIPQGVTVTVESITTLKVSGCDKQMVGEVTAKIRGIKPPEPYKGKGIRYLGEKVKIKEGKSAK